MFSTDDFAKLQFLTGRWKGRGADGKEFYEEYDRPEPMLFRSHRASDASFRERIDGSTIAFQDGEIVSTWGEFTWRASEINADSATFEPVSAPNRFSWRRIDDATLEARQRMNEEGGGQEYTIRLTRVPG